MSVFDQIERTLEGEATDLVGSFDYLNRSTRPEAAAVREMVDAMFANYPAKKRDRLKADLRSIHETKFHSTFFELALHELLLRAGCRIIAIEPEVPGATHKPDFLVADANGAEFYLEATSATGESVSTAAAKRRLYHAIDAIDSVDSPLFTLDVRYDGAPAQPPSIKRFRSRVQRWVDGLDYDAIRDACSKGLDDGDESGIPVLKFDEHGCVFEIRPMPREARDDHAQRAIGLLGLAMAIRVDPHIRASYRREAVQHAP